MGKAKKGAMFDKEKEKRHPSYGMLSFSRVTGSKQNLFGSSIEHRNFIILRISPAVMRRDLSHDWPMEDGIPFIEVGMSYSQFADSLTSMDHGSGTPVTVRSVGGKQIEECPHESKRKQFSKEFSNFCEGFKSDFVETIQALKTSAEKGRAGTTELAELLKKVEQLRQSITSNLPFIETTFQEQTEKTIHEAKKEIEAHVEVLVKETGLTAILDGVPSLKDGKNRRKIKK